MRDVTITFSVEHSGTCSNQIIKDTQMDYDLYQVFNNDISRTGGQNLAAWIQNNLVGTVLEQAMPNGPWRVVHASISRRGW